MRPAIFGLAGASLSAGERDFFRDADSAGYILFGRNCVDRAQLRALTDALRNLHGRDALPILIDQEGGRVARMRPPEWPEFPSADRFDALYRIAPVSAIEAARANAQAIASLLRESGLNVDCLPVLDLRGEDTHAVIGDRALGSEPMQVAALGRAMIEGLCAGGVAGVVKHMPGQGRATCDSHVELPVVAADAAELERDLEPFRSLRDAPMGMAAHIVYAAWDAEQPASMSPAVIGGIIRDRIGFEGWLMSDDIGMQALDRMFGPGSLGARARSVVAAGCDAALHCSGVLAEMVEVANALAEIGTASRDRLARAMASIAHDPAPHSYRDLAAKRDALLSCA